MRLGEVASIRSGLVLSRKLAKEPTEYRYRLLNLRSIHPKGYVELDQLDVYDAKEPLGAEYLTRPGDIIVRLSAPYTAVLIDRSSENLVVSSNFVLIRTEQNALLPEYLHWLLNTEKVNRRIYEISDRCGSFTLYQWFNFGLCMHTVQTQFLCSMMPLLLYFLCVNSVLSKQNQHPVYFV